VAVPISTKRRRGESEGSCLTQAAEPVEALFAPGLPVRRSPNT